MNKEHLENFMSDMMDEKITLHKQTKGGKWFECEYTSIFNEIELSTIYGVSIAGNISGIDFDIKTASKQDNILKTVSTQIINKYLRKQLTVIDGVLQYPTKEQVIKEIKKNPRVSKYIFYTTLYGIGYFCMFLPDQMLYKINNKLSEYLKENNIDFYNEFSDAHWVYRFVINKDVETHNKLLENFDF